MPKIVSQTFARFMLFLTPALLGSGCDLHSKLWVEETLRAVPGQALPLIEPWLELALAYNRGTAFSFVSDLGFARAVLGVFAFALALGFLFAVLRAKHMTWLEIVALGLVAGGALGNGIDRLFHEVPGGGTGVVDFIRINYPWGGSWPAFNIADVLIAVGAGLLLIVGFSRRRERGASPQYG